MAKGSRGGKRGSGGGAGAGGILDADQVVQQVQAPLSVSADFNAFMAMTDDEKADVITKLTSQDVPDHLADNDLQKFIYNIGMNDKPDVVDDATLDSMQGIEMFRTVNSVWDKQKDISYNADQIVKQVQGGRVTRTDGSASLLGRGIYFADDYSHSVNTYGNTKGNVKKTAVMRAKLNSNAKIITDSAAQNGVYAEIRKGTKLGKALSRCESSSQSSIYALAKGYNVIKGTQSSWVTGYYNVLNRQAMTMSNGIKATGSKW